MDFFNEFGLAFAVALPVVVIIAMNAFLALSGERGTLLVPGTSRYPEIAINRQVSVEPAATAGFDTANATAANEEVERQAA